MSRTWIIYNKPGEPDAIHAEHEITTVGLMLGLAAWYGGLCIRQYPSLSMSIYPLAIHLHFLSWNYQRCCSQRRLYLLEFFMKGQLTPILCKFFCLRLACMKMGRPELARKSVDLAER